MYSLLTFMIYTYIYISSIGMITSHNPIYSILFMVNILVLIALNLILLDIAYLGLIFIMIYVGAIIILFLFVVMMIPLKKVAHRNTTYLAISFYFLLFLFYLLVKYINKYTLFANNYFMLSTDNVYSALDNSNILALEDTSVVSLLKVGTILFNYYYIYLFIIGFILLVIMVGSIFLTNEQQGKFIRKQFNAVYRHSAINVCNYYF